MQLKLKFIVAIVALPLLIGIGGEGALASSLDLTATIRDFNSAGTTVGVLGQPDFGSFGPTGVVTGLVQSQLGADGKPVFGPNGSTAITSATSFSQWYNTIPSVNLATTITLSANETSPGSGIFTYTNTSYFPIDGQLLGNQGQTHNFNFTTEIDTTFTYQPGQNQTISVTGNDDIWVFINNKLVIDLGGIHGAATGNLTLTAAEAALLGLTAGGVYGLDIFQANRAGIISEFDFSTSMNLQQTPLPAALPLFATGLGGLGLLGWRRKRKAQAVA